MGCLKRIKQHLKPHGRFVFNLPNPTCDFILKCATTEGREFEERGRYELDDGSSILVEQAYAGKTEDQCIETTLRMTVYDCEGREVEKGRSAWTTRYLFRYEAIHLLYRCGFRVETLVGDYKNGPVTQQGQLIFEVRLAE
jgi:hypothetical protein